MSETSCDTETVVESFVESVSDSVEYQIGEQKENGVTLQFNTLIAKRGGEYLFLDRVFDHDVSDPDSLSGAVGTSMVPIHEDDLQRRRDEYKDPEWSPLAHIWEEQNGCDPENHPDRFSSYVENEMKYGDPLVYDPSYSYQYGDTVREKCEWGDEIGDNGHAVECIGGGRMFNRAFDNYDTIYRPDLLMLARYVENNGIDI